MRAFGQLPSPSLLRCFSLVAVLGIVALSSEARAQTSASTKGKLVITVTDPSGGVIPSATVTIAGLDASTKAMAVEPDKTSTGGSVTFENLVPGRYNISATFPGFEVGLLKSVQVNRGDNKHIVVLPIKGMAESVTVGTDAQTAAATRATRAFGLNLSQDEINALSDDPTELARQLAELGGPDAIIRVDSFEGQQLPPKSQIKSIHVTRDQFAAETEQPGSTFVDVITQPGLGPIRGGANMSFRNGTMAAKSQFTPTKGPEEFRGYGFNIGGALIQEKSNFSIAVNGQNQYITPNLNVALPNGATRFDVLGVRQPSNNVNVNALFDYALTRDQTLRFGYSEGHNRITNLGIGAYDLPERAWSQDQNSYQFRALEAGPIGRRSFINTRLAVMKRNFGGHSAVEAPTIVVRDAFTSGGAQQAGRVYNTNLNFASDIDYIRGRNSWRGGVQLYADWYRANLNNNYLGTYTFSSLDAFNAGTPFLYTRSAGDPLITFFHARVGGYFQDDIRVRKGLTLSPGVRYSYQTRVDDTLAFEPRLGVTWSPGKSGKTTLRASGGIFHGWLDPGIWWQTVRFDANHQREIIITNPTFPDPGTGAVVPAANTYRLGAYKLNKNVRYSAGIDQRFSPRASVNLLFNYYHQDQLPRGTNLNPLTNGVRPDPAFANIIQTITDAEIIRHEFFANFNFSLVAPTPALARAKFNWRRLAVNGSYSYIRAERNAMGPFDVPASGTLETEWGNGPADNPFRLQISIVSTQLRNLTVNFAISAADGNVYNEFTGFDDNGDGLLNDRPAGVGIWSLRGDRVRTFITRFTYNIPLPNSPAAQGGPPRYRLSVYANINNLTNHANYVGYSGIMTSPFFLKPTAVQNPRKLDVGLNIAF